MNILIIGLFAVAATLFGGLFALRFKDKLHLILGFSAGTVIGLAFFDLIPEAIERGSGVYSADVMIAATAAGFSIYMVLDRFLILHGSHEDECHNEHHSAAPRRRGAVAALSLSLHSFLDGVAIGVAFSVSPSLGIIVTAAVLAHGFSDGINTVNFIMRGGGERKEALRWLALDAAAPVVGVAVSFATNVKEATLGLLLAIFAGFFLYIGASDLLPESHHGHSMKWTTVMTLLGLVGMFAVVKLTHI